MTGTDVIEQMVQALQTSDWQNDSSAVALSQMILNHHCAELKA